MSEAVIVSEHGCEKTPFPTEQKCKESPPFVYRRYGRRQWAVYCGEELVCVVAYRKGARALIEWLTRGKKAPAAHQPEKREFHESTASPTPDIRVRSSTRCL